MLRNRSAVLSLLVVLGLAFAGTGCGGSDDAASPLEPAGATEDSAVPEDDAAEEAAAEDVATPDTAGAASDSATQSDASVDSGGGDSEAPQLAQGTWEGTLHFEITGDVEASEDLFGAAQTSGAFTLMSFTATDSGAGSQIGFTADSNEEAAVFVTSEDFTGGGEIGIGKPCSVTMSKNDETAAEGSFTCKQVSGVSTQSLEDDLVVDIEGTFTLARP
jgi:hypothetical protein